MKKSSGFSLIELLVTVAIIGIIAAIAMPFYSTYMTKTRRTEAKALLAEVAGEQQRFYSENNTYADKLSEIGYPVDAVASENGYYTVSVTAQSTTSFTLTAKRVAGKAQAGDAGCGDMTINSLGTKGHSGSSSVADCW